MKRTQPLLTSLLPLFLASSIGACGDDNTKNESVTVIETDGGRFDGGDNKAPSETDGGTPTDDAPDAGAPSDANGGPRSEDGGTSTEDGGTSADHKDASMDEILPEQAHNGVYGVVTQVFGSEGGDNTSYVVVVDGLDGQTLALDSAIEVPGRAIGAGFPGSGAMFVGGGSSANITRYDLNGKRLTKTDEITFAARGLAAIGEYGAQFQFVKKDKAYFFDGATAQAVIWNPESMVVIGGIALDDLVLQGSVLTFSAAPLQAHGQVITFAGWREGPTVPSRSAVVLVDAATDAATIVIDDRGGYVRDGVLGADGLIYMATEAYGAAVHRLNDDNAAAPCLIRFDPKTGQFDPDFYVTLESLTNGTAGSIFAAPGGGAFLAVLDEDVFPIAVDTHPRVLASADTWVWGPSPDH